MVLLDIVLVLLAAAAGVAGWTMGLVSRLVSWLGLAAGLIVVSLILPPALERLDHLDEQWLLVIAVTAVLVGAVAGQAIGMAAGGRLRERGDARYDRIDAVGGAIMGVLGIAVVVWLLAPAVRTVPGWSADQVEDSAVVGLIESATPDPPDTFRTLRRLVGVDRFPEVFADRAPGVEVGPPPTTVDVGADVLARVSEAVVRVRSVACAQRQDGTGFLIAPGVILTNAHVVAGAADVEVFDRAEAAHQAVVVAYDPDRDLALLRVGIEAEPLSLGEGTPGEQGAVLGHPLGGELRAAPAEIAERVRANGRDLYDEHDTVRQVFFLAASLQPGDSGAPLIGPSGDVLGVIFAIAPEAGDVAFALTGVEVGDFLSEHRPVRLDAVDTDDCV